MTRFPSDTDTQVRENGVLVLRMTTASIDKEIKTIKFSENKVSEGTLVRSLSITECTKTKALGKLINKMNKFFPDCNLRQVFYVIDSEAPSAANQKFHFDTIPSIKLICNLSGGDMGGTEFAIKSHLGFRQKINRWIVKKGIYAHHKYGFQNVDVSKLEKVDTLDSELAVFDTDVVHRALVSSSVSKKNPRRLIIAAWSKPI